MGIHALVFVALLGMVVSRPILIPPVMTAIVLPKQEKAAPPPPVPSYSPIRPPAIVAIMPQVTITPQPQAIIAHPQPPTPPQPPSPPASNAGAVPPSSYLARLFAHLAAYKHYPYETGTHAQGIVKVHFAMDRGGHLLTLTLAGSSGSPELDEAALAQFRRAQPLPPVPDDYPGDVLDLVLPLQFTYTRR